ncbi:hypothetical protein B0H66DRAFT_119375 [Apodospora peruviana]|uniref:DUF6590 domain-containing protein n=1 Tax=Apodospora peruviana TaxID=516989 RepID=A0AAE0MAU7_9PEZI|nr:hypothetical protein B0H66DRAFT_119375 [Apodospora peruviana]
MSASSGCDQWAGSYDWPTGEDQHPQYDDAPRGEAVDDITAGISEVSLQESPYAQGAGYTQNMPYVEEPSYIQDGSFAQPGHYAQDGPYPQTTSYPQDEPYSQDAPYTQDVRYSGEAYTYQNANKNRDTGNAYTTSRSGHSGGSSKSKSKSNDHGGHNRSKGTKEKDRDRDPKKGKGQSSSSSKKQRQNSGKAYPENDYAANESNFAPFYNRTTRASISAYGSAQGDSLNPDNSQSADSTGFDLPNDGSRHEGDYEHAAPQGPGVDQLYYEDNTAGNQPSGYPYSDPYARQDYLSTRPSKHSGKRRARTSYQPPPPEPYAEEDISEELASAIEQSDGYMGAGSTQISSDPSIDPSPEYPSYMYEDSAGQQTPRAGTPLATGLSSYPYSTPNAAPGGTTSTVVQAELDERFIVEPSHRFSVGEVFKVVWVEPLGTGRADMTECDERSRFGERIYVGIRRFIIVGTDEGHSTCVPILTYEHRACTKRGLKPRTHGIIYSEGSKPKLLQGEPKLGFSPVRMNLDYPSERLAMESRVNYSKLITVEHNLKVFFIGRIASSHLNIVADAVDECWSYKNKIQKDRDNRKHRDNRDYRSYRY